MEASLESYFDINDYARVANDKDKKRIDKPEFDFFKFKAEILSK